MSSDSCPSRGAVSDRDGAVGGRLDALLERVATGDLGAFGELYDELAPSVFGIASRAVLSPELAEEVTQDVFVWVWRSARSFDRARGSAAALISTVARRRAVDAVRREAAIRRKALLLADEPLAWEGGTHPPAALEEREQVQELMTELTELEREAIRLSYWEGLSGPELASRLGVKLATAKSRKRDGLMRMRAAVRAIPLA